MRKSYRVKSEKEFSKIFHEGKSMANRQFVIYCLDKSQSHFRIGISVGKRIGNAVVRNRIKRYIRQAITELKPHLPSSVDFIVIARKPTGMMNQHQIKKSLIHVLNLSKMLGHESNTVEMRENSES